MCVCVCVSTVAGSKIFVIDPLIISPSSYMVQHIVPTQIYHPLSDRVIYHLAAASIPLTCHWSLTRPARKWITERARERKGPGKGVNVQR